MSMSHRSSKNGYLQGNNFLESINEYKHVVEHRKKSDLYLYITDL